jgi:hypothetical protein
MRLEAAFLISLLVLAPTIYGVLGDRNDTPIFNDKTPGQNDFVGTYALLPLQFSFDPFFSWVILRMGAHVDSYDGLGLGATSGADWSWQPNRVLGISNPTSMDVIDYEGNGFLNDVVYIAGSKKISILKGDKDESENKEPMWSHEFDDEVRSLRSTDLDGDGRVDDLIVASGRRIFLIRPTDNVVESFPVSEDPLIIAPADLDNDGKKNDVVVGSWSELTTEDGKKLSNGRIRIYFSNGNPGWSYPSTPRDEKITYLTSFDRDSDGSDDDLIIIFTDDTDPESPTSDLFIVSLGSQVFFKPRITGASPADFDKDAIKDDFIVVSESKIQAYNSEDTPRPIETLDRLNFNTTDGGLVPRKFLGVTALSLDTVKNKNVFNDAVIFSVITSVATGEQGRVLFFVEDFGASDTETISTTTTTTSTTTTTTTLAPIAPIARISGIPQGSIIQKGKTFILDGSGSRDSDGEIISYQWLLDDELVKTGAQATSFALNTAELSAGTHVIQLILEDNDHQTASTEITFIVAAGNLPPIALAGEDRRVIEGSSVRISAEDSSDPDGEIVKYEWSEDGIVFSTKKSEEKIFSVGIHEIALSIEDDVGATSSDTVVITVVKENLPPKAVAGEDVTVTEGTSVHLSANRSTDQDGNITSYVWTLPDGKLIKMAEFDAQFPVGTHKIALNVTDDRGAVGTDEIVVTVEKLPGPVENIRVKYGSEIKISLITLFALVISVVVFLRTRASRGLY